MKPSIIACLRISGRELGLIFADFEHDLVVQPRDRTANYASVEQSIVGISERQHRRIGAGALNRQIAAAGVVRSSLAEPALRPNPAYAVSASLPMTI